MVQQVAMKEERFRKVGRKKEEMNISDVLLRCCNKMCTDILKLMRILINSYFLYQKQFRSDIMLQLQHTSGVSHFL